MSEIKFPSEEIDLPSRGLIYPEDNPLSSGKVEMKYMSALEEDILTNQNYIEKGTVLDKLLESMIISEISIKDLIVGDKNALLVASRILGYGKDYSFKQGKNPKIEVDLSTLENKKFDESLIEKGINNFKFTLPTIDTELTFKIITGKDEKNIEREIEGLKRINPDKNTELSTRMKYIITSVGGDTEVKNIRKFVDSPNFLARDSKALRDYIRKIQPDVNFNHTLESGEEVIIPVGVDFFWPDL